MAEASVAVMWFRRDLRLADNPALVEAARAADRVVPLFVLDNHLRTPSGPNRLAFMYGCLRELDAAMKGNLVIRAGPPHTKVRTLAKEVGATAVFCAEDFGPYGTQRDEEVEKALASDGIELRRVGSPYAVPPGTIANKSGDHFKVFTPFSKAWRAHGWEPPTNAPRAVTWATGIDSDGIPDAPKTDADLPDPGEEAGMRRLAAFLEAEIHDYAERRNLPGDDGTSRLSPYLKWGCLHPRQLLDRLGSGKGETTFAKELCWRDFYADVIFHRPDTVRQSFDPKMRGMQTDTGKRADERLAAWKEGRTGYPIVDAGMRQLQAQAWVHNRVRMIVASFLVKDLHLDWTLGARHFMHHLVDGDVASNHHGWQWTAGTGTDPAPYFRIFNPVSQSKKFDPDGTYIKRWVPELAALGGDALHAPWTADQSLFGEDRGGYPGPIVDHAAERTEALRRYDAVRGSAARSGG